MQYLQEQAIVFQQIALTIPDSLYLKIKGKPTVKEAWDALIDCPKSGPGQVWGIFSGPGPGPPRPVQSLAGPGPGPHWTGSTRVRPGPGQVRTWT